MLIIEPLESPSLTKGQCPDNGNEQHEAKRIFFAAKFPKHMKNASNLANLQSHRIFTTCQQLTFSRIYEKLTF